MNVVYLLLGSNLYDRALSLSSAKNEISNEIGAITDESSIYESEPWGFISEDRFLNQVIRIETRKNPVQVLNEILRIETKLGRKRDTAKGYSSRILDIDILFFNNEIISEENLIIPHPKISERMFTLLPLSEINNSLIHPGLNKSIQELMEECHDQSVVLKLSVRTIK